MGILISKLNTREINKEQFEAQSNKLLSLHSLRNLSLTWSRNALNTITTRNYDSEKNSTNLIRKGIHIFKYFPMININCLIIHRQHGRHCMLTFSMRILRNCAKRTRNNSTERTAYCRHSCRQIPRAVFRCSNSVPFEKEP
jgi:hypothetical protein